jgi:hypothetical protein
MVNVSRLESMKPVIYILALLAALPITPIILSIVYGWSNT